jgi:hypothetical protein
MLDTMLQDLTQQAQAERLADDERMQRDCALQRLRGRLLQHLVEGVDDDAGSPPRGARAISGGEMLAMHDRLRDHRVDAFVAVHQLRHAEVASEAH